MTRRRLAIEPSCTREIATFPSERAALLWDEIEALVSDPLPDGSLAEYQAAVRPGRGLPLEERAHAMRGSMLLVPQGCRRPDVVDLDPDHWHVESTP